MLITLRQDAECVEIEQEAPPPTAPRAMTMWRFMEFPSGAKIKSLGGCDAGDDASMLEVPETKAWP
jgi:hypothetical protein